ncbi:hypothetical protein [Microbacterium sp. 1.5R]|uniref:hypothetical protein n=1 Tax=Microbacterium sp. 1.5R TaxID=1916917 RepID=UPI0011AACD1E|nr:hypothetical protein [Microbacterium sp. 1.5R]
MTTLHTLPLSRPTSLSHEHAWLVDSRHRTSEGVLLYVRCGECATRRVDLQTHPAAPPSAVSIELAGP